MPNWGNIILTNAGKALEDAVKAGGSSTSINFTKWKLGSGTLPEGVSWETRTDLVTPVMNIPITSSEAQSTGGTLVSGVATNKDLTVGFNMKELGLFATGTDGGEILYGVLVDSNPDYLSAKEGTTVTTVDFSVLIVVDDDLKVTATLSADSLLRLKDLTAELATHNTDPTAHPDIRQKLNSYLPLTGGTVTGTLNVPTQDATDNSTKAANTAFVQSAVNSKANEVLSSSKAYTDNLSSITPLKKYTLDLSALDENTFYPVVFYENTNSIEAEIHSASLVWSEPYNQNVLSFSVYAGGGSDGSHQCTIKNYYVFDTSEITIGCLGVGATSGTVYVWLRGGKPSPYIIISTVKPQLFANGRQTSDVEGQIATVGPTYHGAETGNANLNIIFSPLDIPSGSAKNLYYTTYGTFEKAIKDADGRVIKDTYATKSDVANTYANLVNSAPETLDTLNELANALGNDPNFATTVTKMISQKADKTVVDNIVNVMYPVGIIVEFAKDVDPNATWVGTTWERMSSGRVLVSTGTSSSGTTYTLGKTGGEESHKLTNDEMPLHNHASTTSSEGGHTHTGTTDTAGNHTHTLHKGNSGSGGAYFSQGQVYGLNSGTVSPPDYAGDHNHTFTTSSNGTHTHTITVSDTGGGKAHNNMQPYEVVNRWKRTA